MLQQALADLRYLAVSVTGWQKYRGMDGTLSAQSKAATSSIVTPSDQILTTREAADLLGVSTSTVQKWIEIGVLSAWKTPGGHRRVRRADVVALTAQPQAHRRSFESHQIDDEFVLRGDESFPMAANEANRLAHLAQSGLVGSPNNATLDRIARIAATVTHSPIALVSVLTARRQWYKARVGLTAASAPRAWSLCSHTILGNAMFIVPDTLVDPRFVQNQLVTGAPYIRAYAGVPLHDTDGWLVGALCVIDRKPRRSSDFAHDVLPELAQLAMGELHRETSADR